MFGLIFDYAGNLWQKRPEPTDGLPKARLGRDFSAVRLIREARPQ